MQKRRGESAHDMPLPRRGTSHYSAASSFCAGAAGANALANSAGISPSTIYSILNTKSLNPGIVTLKQICDGMEITLREFFDSPIFDNLEQEIQ